MNAIQTLLTDHLDIWAAADTEKKSGRGRSSGNADRVYGIRKLRELILELAVRGKLVPQDPNDEPASALLQKVLKENARLLKERNKKPNEAPEITDGEITFQLPKGWEYVRNGSLFSLRKGKKPTNISDSEIGLPYLDIEALDRNNVFRFTDDDKCPRATEADILVVCDGSRSGLVLDGKNGVIGSTLAVIDTPKLIQPFIKLLFMESYERMNSTMKGAAIPHLDTSRLILEIVGLPPLNEQYRIIAQVDELMALCDQLEQQQIHSIEAHQTLVASLLGTLTHVGSQQEFSAAWARIASHFDTLFTTDASIDQLKQTILQLAVAGKLSSADVSDKPMSTLLEEIMIERKRVGATKKELEYFEEECQAAKKSVAKNRVMLKTRFFCAFITKGTTPASTELLQTGDVPFLKVYNIVSNRVDFDYKPTFISKEVHESKLKRSVLFPGDVIMNIVGPPLGKVAIVPEQYPEWNMNQALAIFRPMGDIYNRYLYYMLSSETVLKTVLADVKGTAGQDNLSLEQCRDLLVPMPSVEEQHRIVAKVDELMALCDALKARLADAQASQLHLADAIVEQAVC